MADEAARRLMFATFQPRPAGLGRKDLPAGMEIDEGTSEDAEGVARILAEREGIGLEEALGWGRKWDQGAVDKRLLLVARVDGAVVGYGRVKWVEKPPEAEYERVPEGWYLMGVIVAPAFRRRGIGEELTRKRLAWIRQRAREAYYFANSRNRVSIDLHERLGFQELMRDFRFPRAHFSAGVGILFRLQVP